MAENTPEPVEQDEPTAADAAQPPRPRWRRPVPILSLALALILASGGAWYALGAMKPPAEPARWIYISVGERTTAAIKPDGTLWSWGRNDFGQLGNGTKYGPQPNPGQVGVKIQGSLAAGNRDSAAKTPSPKPTPDKPYRNDPTPWLLVAAGAYHMAGIRTDGTLWAWGANSLGEVGDGTTTDVSLPAKVGGDHHYTDVAVGDGHTLAVDDTGTLWAWGNNAWGQLGDGTTIDRHRPERIRTATRFTKVAAGSAYSLAIDTRGRVWGWGQGLTGQLGTKVNTQTTPRLLPGLTHATAIAAAADHAIALTANGVRTWGHGEYGVNGNDDPSTAWSPTAPALPDTAWKGVCAADKHAAALASTGRLYTWGANDAGQLGRETNTDTSPPGPVDLGSGLYIQITCAGEHAAALADDGTLHEWGQPADGTTHE